MMNEINLKVMALEQDLKESVQAVFDQKYEEYFQIIYYQMGWEKGNTRQEGKRIRPLLLFLTLDALGENWKNALPAASALELIHNYSLIHDDIEDKSQQRRGKDTIWVKWGEAQAINAGDAMLNLALQTPWRLEKSYSTENVARVMKKLQERSFELTQGQFLDISFEKQENISIKDYFLMIEGKTCSLIKASFEIAAILANVNEKSQKALQQCGSALGRAYQIQDDWLGIWGDEARTGKSNQSDLLERKKTYPVLLGLNNSAEFSTVWKESNKLGSNDVAKMAKILERDGIKKDCEIEFDKEFKQALESLQSLNCDKSKLNDLVEFIEKLLIRQF